MCVGKSKFNVLDKPNTLDWVFMPTIKRRQTNDLDVMEHAVAMIHDHRPQLLFVHFPDTDAAGHTKGWASPEQMEAIERADGCFGEVVAALAEEKVLDSTLVILSADHGGAGIGHGPDDPRSRHIPWIAAGPGVRKNFDLTRIGWLNVNTEDTFATACYVLGLPLAKYVEGRAGGGNSGADGVADGHQDAINAAGNGSALADDCACSKAVSASALLRLPAEDLEILVVRPDGLLLQKFWRQRRRRLGLAGVWIDLDQDNKIRVRRQLLDG